MFTSVHIRGISFDEIFTSINEFAAVSNVVCLLQ